MGLPPGGLFPEWTWIVGFFVGTFIGSFLNVVIYRMPRAIQLANPAYSFCPSCKAHLGMADLWPLFSWLFTKGRCRYCASKVSSRYFWVEFFTGTIWAGIWYQYLCASTEPALAIAYALAASALVAIIFIDWQFYIIPDQVNAFLWFVGILLNVFMLATNHPNAWTWGLPTALTGWLVGVGALWGIAFLGRVLFGKDAMGHGDIKMARGVGAVLGPVSALTSFGIAVALGAVLGIIQKVYLNKLEAREEAAKAAAQPVAEGDSPDMDAPNEAADADEDDEIEPESIGSLVKCGLGYVFLIDIVGLFVPKLYEQFFGESPFDPVDEDEYPIERTMIPFGPYLALGAIVAVVFQAQLGQWLDAYLNWVAPRS